MKGQTNFGAIHCASLLGQHILHEPIEPNLNSKIHVVIALSFTMLQTGNTDYPNNWRISFLLLLL